MLAYRHLFHAGNAADVFKHAVLVCLLEHLRGNAKPFFYLDTHAGIGLYDLEHEWARKNAEFRGGIALALAALDAPAALRPYLELVRASNRAGALRYYPGSPVLARHYLREGDRMALCELNAKDEATLGMCFAHDPRVQLHRMDGYQALKALLPPPERRGLVLVDSPFDRGREFTRLADAVKEAHRRWATGIFAVWYPLMAQAEIDRFERTIKASGIRKILRLELSLFAEGAGPGLRGSALLVVNPPWRLDETAREILPWLWRQLGAASRGRWDVGWLVPE